MKHLIVNADDFGQSQGVNEGVLASHEEGIVTSASLMVRWSAAGEAVDLAAGHPGLGLGLHLDLGEWELRHGEWAPLYEVVDLDDERAVEEELTSQLERFRQLAGRHPTHIDSHQHVHLRSPSVRHVAARMAADLAVPLRSVTTGISYCGDFYGQADDGSPLDGAVSPAALLRILAGVPAGVTELACHPAMGNDLKTMYGGRGREAETRALCDPEVRREIERRGIDLCNFDTVRTGGSRPAW